MNYSRVQLFGMMLLISLALGLSAVALGQQAPAATPRKDPTVAPAPAAPAAAPTPAAATVAPAPAAATVTPAPAAPDTTPAVAPQPTPETGAAPPAQPGVVDFRALAAQVATLTVPVVWQRLPRFGMALFSRAGSSEGQPAQGAAIPASYTLGPGDELNVLCFSEGIEHLNTATVVSPEGKIYLPLAGEVSVLDSTLSAASVKIAGLLRQFYPRSQVTVMVTKPRLVEVYVLGDVLRPGKYALPGMGTIFTALYAAGGPSDIGSLRRVRLLPLRGEPQSYDLYSYLLDGERVSQQPLSLGDTIFVDTQQAEVGIVGEVRRSARYEIMPDMSCADLIKMAGGISPMAYTPNLQVWRVQAGEYRTIAGLTLKDAAQFKLQDGDLVVIRPILEEARQVVSIEGAVRRPGMYDLTPNLRVADLIAKAEGLADNAHLGKAVLWRLDQTLQWQVQSFQVAKALAGSADDNLVLQARDRVHFFTQEEAESPQIVQISGAVRKPDSYEWGAGMRVSDLIMQAGGVLPEVYGSQATIIRFREAGTEREVVQVRLVDALQGNKEADLELLRGDLLHIFTKDEQRQKSEVWVDGFVQHPGAFPRYENMKISDLIFAAGGLTPDASGKGVHALARQVGKISNTDLQITQDNGKIIVQPDLVLGDDDFVAVSGLGAFVRRPPHVKITGRVTNPGAYGLATNTDHKSTVYDVLQEAGGLLPDANPRGILLFRPKSELWLNRQNLLQKTLAGLNRNQGATPNATTTTTAPTSAEQAALAGQVASVFSKGTGEDQVMGVIIPPRNLSLAALVEIVPLDGEKLLATKGKEGDAVVTDDDYIVVQRTLDTVAVFGSVAQSGEIAYQPHGSVRSAVQRVGGLAEDADAGHITVLRANGAALPEARVGELQPGDIVIVPSKYLLRTEGGGLNFFDRLWKGLMQAFALSRLIN